MGDNWVCAEKTRPVYTVPGASTAGTAAVGSNCDGKSANTGFPDSKGF